MPANHPPDAAPNPQSTPFGRGGFTRRSGGPPHGRRRKFVVNDVARDGAAPVNILLVDDEVRNLDVLESVLESPEYRLVRATTADRALLLLLEGEFAAIVLDIQMPEMSGIELANLVKQRKRTQLIPIIFLTAYYQEDKHVLEGYVSGAVDYLTKPVNPQILKSKIGVFVDLYRKTRALAASNRALEMEVAQRQQAEEALRLANLALETRVAARTAELLRANEELREREKALSASEARVQSELEQQRRTEAALLASEAQLRLVTDHAPVFITQLDRDHRFKFVNRTYARRFDFEPEQLIGKHFIEVMGEGPYQAIRHHLDAALDGQRVEFELEIPYASLGRRWVHVIHEPEWNPEGDVIGLVAVINDITERKLVEREVVMARDKALAASRAKDAFLARLSHELRTPLNPVLLLASDAAGNANLPETVRADFEMIVQNVTLEARLIDDLLDLTSITHGKVTLELRPFDIHTILRDTLAMMRAEVSQKNLVVTLELNADRHIVLCDDVRLKQIFWNVLKNAVKFTPDGGRITIATYVQAENKNLAVTFTDTGMGMSADEIERIFETFSQGDHADQGASHRFGGLGLGLAISRMLVERHSGFIRASSPGRNGGSTFHLEFPLFQSEQTKRESAAPYEPAEPTSLLGEAGQNGGARRILLVEDHKPTRNALAHLLTRRHYEVTSAECLVEARMIAARESFDILISDIGLPDGSGYDLMAELRERQGLVGIALTGYGMDEDVDRSQLVGFTAHLTKPVNVEALDRALSAVSRRRSEPGDR